MERLTDISLINIKYETDQLGQQIEAGEATRTLICTLHSITRQEWSSASQQGLKPECMVKLASSDDYEDEEIAEMNGARYSIYRTYLTDDGGIELYLRKDIGPNL